MSLWVNLAIVQRLTQALGQYSRIWFSPSHTEGIHFIRNSLCHMEARNHLPIAPQISVTSTTHSPFPFFQDCGSAFSHFSEPCTNLHKDSLHPFPLPCSPSPAPPQGIHLYLRQNLMFMSQSSYLPGAVQRLVCRFTHIPLLPKTF